jgi:hypothetical protein
VPVVVVLEVSVVELSFFLQLNSVRSVRLPMRIVFFIKGMMRVFF